MSVNGPLEGVKVVDLSLLLPGPLCSMYLADMGAEVIKVENPRAMDATRVMFRKQDGMAPLYWMLNRNKKCITLNLKRPESKDILFRLLEDADLLLEGFRPDTLSKMGLGYDEVLKEKFPGLVYCGIYGYNPKGPKKDFAGHDLNYLSLAGLVSQNGNPPSVPGFQLADVGGGSLTALSGILAALYRKEKTGKGQKISVSMADSSLQFLTLYSGMMAASGKSPEAGDGLLSGHLPNYNVYQTKEGRFVALGALEEPFFKAFLRASGLESHLEAHSIEAEEFGFWKNTISDYFAAKTYQDLEPIFQNTEACLTPVLKMEEVLESEELRSTGMVRETEDPKWGKVSHFAPPFQFSDTPVTYRNLPKEHGEDSESILESLGYQYDQIEEFRKGRVI